MIQRTLNATICDGPTITAVVRPSRPEILVGHGLTKRSLESQRFRVRRGSGKTWCWLNLSFRLCLDVEQKYLTVASSFIGIYATDDDRSCLCHFDYERNKADYPEAHLQVVGDWRHWPSGVDWSSPAGLSASTSRSAADGTARSWRA